MYHVGAGCQIHTELSDRLGVEGHWKVANVQRGEGTQMYHKLRGCGMSIHAHCQRMCRNVYPRAPDLPSPVILGEHAHAGWGVCVTERAISLDPASTQCPSNPAVPVPQVSEPGRKCFFGLAPSRPEGVRPEDWEHWGLSTFTLAGGARQNNRGQRGWLSNTKYVRCPPLQTPRRALELGFYKEPDYFYESSKPRMNKI